MKTLSKLMMIVAIGIFSAAASADDKARAAAEKVFELKDGSTIYIFKNGKMAMEDKLGRATRMKPDTVMETKDGQKIIMNGDEVTLLSFLKREGHGR